MVRKTKKCLAMMLAITMLLPGIHIYAAAPEPWDNLCQHHAQHNETCGYPGKAEAVCGFQCEVCALPALAESPEPDPGNPISSGDSVPTGNPVTFGNPIPTGIPVPSDTWILPKVSHITAVTVDNNFGGPPPLASRCTHPGGKLNVTPLSEDGYISGAAFAWYRTGQDNITDGANSTYSVTDPALGTSLNNTDDHYTPSVQDFGNYLYCIVTVDGDSITSSAFKVISAPALIGDLIIDYTTNTISAPLEKDGESPLMSPDTYGMYMAENGEFRIENGGGTIEAKKPAYSNGLLSATFNTDLSGLNSFGISFFHPYYFGILRESGGKVPADIILPGVPSVIITLSGGEGNSQIPLTDSYVQNVIAKVASVNEGKKIVLAMSSQNNSVDLSRDVLGAVADGDALYADIDSAKLTINKDLLSQLHNMNSGAAITAERKAVPDNMDIEAKEAIGERPVVDLSITAGGTPVTQFAGDGKVIVSIPYTLAPGEDADNVRIYYLKNDGTAEVIADATYSSSFVTFSTSHFSMFAVGYAGMTSSWEWNPLPYVSEYNNLNFGVGFEGHTPPKSGCNPLSQVLTVKTDGLTATGYQWYIAADNGVELKTLPQSKDDALTRWGPILENGLPQNATKISSGVSASMNTSILKDQIFFKGIKDVRYLFCQVTLQDGTMRYTPVRSVVPDTWGEGGDVDYPYQPIPPLFGAKYEGYNSDTKIPSFIGEKIIAKLSNIASVNTSDPSYQWYIIAEKDIESLIEIAQDNTNNQFPRSNASITAIHGATSPEYIPGLSVAGRFLFCRITADGKTFDTPVRVASFMVAPNIKKNADGKFAVTVNPAARTISMTLEDVPDNGPFRFDADECGQWAVNNGRIQLGYVIDQTEYAIMGGSSLTYDADTNTLTSPFDVWPASGNDFSFILYSPPYLIHPDSTVTVNALGEQIEPTSSGTVTSRVVLLPEAPEDSAVADALEHLSKSNQDTTELGLLIKGRNAILSAASVIALGETAAPNAPDAKVALMVETPAANMKLDETAIKAMIPASGNVVISAVSTDIPSNVDNTVKGQIGNRPVVNLTIFSHNIPVTSFGPGSATVRIPYTLSANENADNLVIYYLKDDGTTEKITNVSYSHGFVTFTTNHFSKFAIGYQSSFQDGGDSSGSTQNNSSATAAPSSSPEQPKLPVNAETKIEAKTDAKGKTSATVPEQSVTDAIKTARDAAKKAGTEDSGITITISLTARKTAGSIAVTLPQSAVARLVQAQVDQLWIKSSTVHFGLDLLTLKQIQAAGGKSVTISADKVSASRLSRQAQSAMGRRPVYTLSIKSGNKTVSSFGGGSVTVALPYTPAAGEKPGSLYGVYVDKNGKVTCLTNSSYDDSTKMLLFCTPHFSTFGIGCKQDVPAFTDTADHWAKNDIDFVAARGLLTGTGAATFSPDTGMTRGMIVTALGRMADIDTSRYTATKFTDVKAAAFYAPFAEWAVENGITGVTGTSTFSPDQVITRQELAAIMQYYARAMGFKIPKTRESAVYADEASIGTLSKDAVKAMQMAGVMNGKNNNQFDPTGMATRAETAAALKRYTELVIHLQTAQGLDQNDSGSPIMYENGKRVKSASRTADGVTYAFNANGEAALSPGSKAIHYSVQKGDSFWRIAYKFSCTISQLEQLNGKSRNEIIYAGQMLKVPNK